MSLAKRIMSVVLSFSLSFLSISAVRSAAVNEAERGGYVYDSILSPKSKDLVSDSENPFNVFDIYNAYYGIETTTTDVSGTTASTMVTQHTTTAVSTASLTSATKELTTTVKPLTTARPTTMTTAFTTAPAISETTLSSAASTQVSIPPSATCLNGIDVSQYQYNIDWPTVKSSGEIDYAIIKAGWGNLSSQTDPFFQKNMAEAQAVGMDVGLYWFSYADSVEDAEREAYACLDVIKGYSFTYPIYYDFEYEWALHNLSVAELSAMIDTFCTILQENGYYVGVYGSGSYLENSIYRHVLSKYEIWVAEYGTSSVQWYTGEYGMWQYTGSGEAPGISTIVDRDYCYKDYSSIIGVNPSNGSLPVTTASTSDPNISVTTQTTVSSSVQTTFPVTTTQPRGYMIEDTSLLYDWGSFDKNTYQYAMLCVMPWQNFEDVKGNINAAHAAGIDCGILYLADDAYSDTVSSNAARLYNTLSTVKLEYPVYYWFNKADLSGYNVSLAQLSVNAEVFCSYFESQRYFVGVAAYDNALITQLDNSLFEKYSVWLFNEQGTYISYQGACGMISSWDYTIGGYVHHSHEPFPSIMSNVGLNGYTKPTS